MEIEKLKSQAFDLLRQKEILLKRLANQKDNPKMKNKNKNKKKFNGSWGWVIFWAIIFWPVAIVYFFMNYGEEK